MRRGRVLVVDDEGLIRNALRRSLAHEHDVTAANDGFDALELIEAGARFDVILCDLKMPGMNGADLLGAIAELDGGQADRMLFITGDSSDLAARVSDHIVIGKPFDPKCVRKLVHDTAAAFQAGYFPERRPPAGTHREFETSAPTEPMIIIPLSVLAHAR